MGPSASCLLSLPSGPRSSVSGSVARVKSETPRPTLHGGAPIWTLFLEASNLVIVIPVSARRPCCKAHFPSLSSARFT